MTNKEIKQNGIVVGSVYTPSAMTNPIDDIDNILMKLRGAQVEPTDLTSWNNTRTAIKNLLLEARLDELKRLKMIDAFNEAYSTDPRCSKLVDIRIASLQKELE